MSKRLRELKTKVARLRDEMHEVHSELSLAIFEHEQDKLTIEVADEDYPEVVVLNDGRVE